MEILYIMINKNTWYERIVPINKDFFRFKYFLFSRRRPSVFIYFYLLLFILIFEGELK